MNRKWKALLSGGAIIAAGMLWSAANGRVKAATAETIQTSQSGEISGTVTANRDYALSEASGNHICFSDYGGLVWWVRTTPEAK